MNHKRKLIHAAMIADGMSVRAAPGAVLIEDDQLVTAGSPQQVGEPSDCLISHLPDAVVIPALVNSHCHLDLTHIGHIPFTGSFTSWIEVVRNRRALSDSQIHDSVAQGVELARAGGTAIIGDIAGVSSLQPVQSLRSSGLAGVSFFEVFGIGRGQARTAALLRDTVERCPDWEAGVAFGIQPHAPYSCGLDVYQTAVELKRPLSTHLAETLEELSCVQFAAGPLEQMLKRLGVWDDQVTGSGQHPIAHLEPVLRERPFVAAHLNYLDDVHVELLSNFPITVVYCPRASAYFGHPHPQHPPHRYREMMEAGINVALGTDSFICLNTPDRMSVLDDMRALYRRDATDPIELLRMATTNGAIGLGFDSSLVALKPGRTAGLLAVSIGSCKGEDPLRQVLMNNEPPRWVLGPMAANNSWRGTILE